MLIGATNVFPQKPYMEQQLPALQDPHTIPLCVAPQLPSVVTPPGVTAGLLAESIVAIPRVASPLAALCDELTETTGVPMEEEDSTSGYGSILPWS